MTNKNPKKAPGPYRAPSSNGAAAADGTPRRRGLLDGLFAPRVAGTSSMPKIPASLWRGTVAVLSTPATLVAVPLIILVEWAAAVALGFQGPFSVFASALALPPIGTGFDGGLATSLYGAQTGLFLLLGFVALRAVIMSVLTAVIVQVLDEDRATLDALPRGLRIIPTSLAVGIIDMFLLTLSSILVQILGGGIGLLLQIGVLVAGLYLFVFAPIMAVAEGRSMPESLARGIRAARMPGSGNLALAAIYVIPAIAITVVPGLPGKLIGVNPTVGAWVYVIAVNLIHLIFLATFAFRYLSVSDEVPEPPEPRQRRERRR